MPSSKMSAGCGEPNCSMLRSARPRCAVGFRAGFACNVLVRLLVGSEAVVLRHRSGAARKEAFGGESAPQQFAHGRGATRHPVRKAPVIEQAHFLGCQHELKTVAAWISHRNPPGMPVEFA